MADLCGKKFVKGGGVRNGRKENQSPSTSDRAASLQRGGTRKAGEGSTSISLNRRGTTV